MRQIESSKTLEFSTKIREFVNNGKRIISPQHFTTTLQQSERILEKKYLPKRPIEELIEFVAGRLGLKPELICSGSKQTKKDC